MTHRRNNKGVCSSHTTVELDEAGVIKSIQVGDGCDGNLQGLCNLLAGHRAADAAARLRGIRCEDKATSCPDQIALCLEEALAALAAGGHKGGEGGKA